FVCRLLHLKIISLKNPLQIGLCNKAFKKHTDSLLKIGYFFTVKFVLIDKDYTKSFLNKYDL
ncbi:hypothetical protein B9X56_07660, partial [Acinetobacter baumannii]